MADIAASGGVIVGGTPSYGYLLRAEPGGVRIGGRTSNGFLRRHGWIAIERKAARGRLRRKQTGQPGAIVIGSRPVNIRVSHGVLRPTPGGIIIGGRPSRGFYIPLGLFPSLIPTKRKFTPPKYYTTETISESGVKETRLWSATPSRAVLELYFENITNDEAELILVVFYKVYNTVYAVTLPDSIYTGYDLELRAFIENTSAAIEWNFKAEPRVEIGSYPDTCSVNVILHAKVTVAPAPTSPQSWAPIL